MGEEGQMGFRPGRASRAPGPAVPAQPDRDARRVVAKALPDALTSRSRRVKGRNRSLAMIRLVIDCPDPMSRVAAFFDVDRTIVSCNTGRLFLRDLRRRGEISFLRMLRALGWMAKYHLSLIDLQWVATRLAGEMAGRIEREFAETCRKWVEKDVLPLVVPGAREKIEKHRAEGHVLAILSTSPNYVTEPIAETLGIEEVLSTRFEVEGGLFTGRLRGPACVGKGKVHWAEDLGTRRE